MYKKIIKPLLDFLIALVICILTLPILLVVIVLLKLTGHKRVFFLQSRVGIHERFFKVIKLRTMTDKKSATEELLPDAERLTKLGAFLRKTSIDELPQLINVLKGDMSLIGPRPLLIEYLQRYSVEQKRRHLVKPGITGWAQINGRNAISWAKKFELDVWYVDHISFLTDLKILILTFMKVVGGNDISKEGHATTEPFMGNN